jgi:hypothetical protein
MNNIENNSSTSPLIQVIRNFFQKLRQSPDIYPIKYYKKGSRVRRQWQTHLSK